MIKYVYIQFNTLSFSQYIILKRGKGRNPITEVLLGGEAWRNKIKEVTSRLSDLTAAWLVQMVERQFTVREVEGSSPRSDQHLGS